MCKFSKLGINFKTSYNSVLTVSSPRFPLWYHYRVRSEKNSYFFGIGQICDVDLTCKFRPGFYLLYVVSKIGLITIT